MEKKTKENAPDKEVSVEQGVRRTCKAGIIILLLSCVICVVCSIMLVGYNLFFASGSTAATTVETAAATDSSSVEPVKIAATEQTLIPLLGIVISIWVALNIYNAISNKEIQLALRMSEKVKKSLDETEAKINTVLANVKSSMEKTEEKVSHILNTKFGSTRCAEVLSAISENTQFYSFTKFLLYSFENENISKNFNVDILNLIVKIEHTFISASQLNRSGLYRESAELSSMGLDYCKQCREELNRIAKEVKGHSFLSGYLSLREGDFYFYQGYRIQSDKGKAFLDRAVSPYQEASLKIYEFLDDGEKAILQTNNLSSTDQLSTAMQAAFLMKAYLLNVMGECYNVQMQYKEAPLKPGERMIYANKAIIYFRQVYDIYASYIQVDNEIDTVFAKYLRNFGTALERPEAVAAPGFQAAEMYLKALKIAPKDMLSYRNYCSLRLKELSKALLGAASPTEFFVTNSQDITGIKGFAEVYMAADPSNAIGHYFKMLVHLILAFGKNAEENVKIAAAQFETVMVLNPRFQLNQDTKAIRDELKKSNPQLGQILGEIVTL